MKIVSVQIIIEGCHETSPLSGALQPLTAYDTPSILVRHAIDLYTTTLPSREFST